MVMVTVMVFRQYRVHEMRTIAIDDPGVCQSVCLSVRRLLCVAKRVDVLFGLETIGNARQVTTFVHFHAFTV